MRVLWLTPNKPENISVGRERIATHLRASGHEIDIRAGRPGTVASVLRSGTDYDAIVGTTRAGAIFGAVLKVVTGTPLLVDHIDPISQFEATAAWPLAFAVKHLEHLAFRVADCVCYVYPEEQARVERHARAATKTDLGVDFERFLNPGEEVIADARAHMDDLGLAENVAVYVGGLEPIYHIEPMLKSVAHLDGWSLLVLGSGSLESSVAAAAADSEQVVFPGTVPHETVPGYLHAADVGVSLVDDPHTLKVLEYGAAGLPTVQLAGRAEAKLGDAVGYCSTDPADIAAAIERAAGTDATALRDLASEYAWSAIAATYARELETIL